MARLPLRVVLAVGAAEIHLRTRFPRFMDAITTHRHRSGNPNPAALEADSHALFVAELDAAIAARFAEVTELEAFAEAVEAASETLRAMIRPNGEGAA
ncbi:hypothetical protein [Streptomyces sp. NBC_00342]|uniref:hypothetical protein n=1 Tax=Streptomyces sp. NBC_00342 TaxID=2975718 RepID=UPI002E2A9D82|nr:hypothetical protein [Streptomyces sp. NBC_00342]